MTVGTPDGWALLNAAIAEARAAVAAAAPDPDTAAKGEAYVSRVVTAALAPAFLGHRLTQAGLSMPLPVYGGPNPDYIMRHASISPDERYRLEGRINGSERVGIGIYTVGANGAPRIAGYTALHRQDCAADGSFALTIAADATGPGTLAIPPAARILMIRLLHRDDSEPASLALSGGQKPIGPTLMTGSNDGALAFAARMVRANIAEYMKWVSAARALPNRLDFAPPELADTVVGDADTQYFLGGFDLGAGEWLEVTMPAGLPGYWSLHAYNFWYEHLVTPGVHDRNATAEADGTLRIAIGPSLPGNQPNRIDSLGHRRGALVCRVVGAEPGLTPPAAVVRRG